MTFNFTVKEFILGGGTGTPTFQFYKRGFELGVQGGSPSPSWVDIVLSGNGSLTLTNAKKNSISYLKLFGGLEQRNLPKEYTQLDYAVIPADSYVKCLTQPVSGGRVELDFQTTSLYTSALRNYYGGRYDGATAGAGIRLCRVATSKRIVMYGFDTSTAGQATGDYVFEGNTRYQYVYDNGTSTLSTGGSVVETKTFTINDTTTSDVAVNSYRQNDGTYSTATERIYVYSYKNYAANGALLENWIPVQKENTVYFYDTVSGTELSTETGSASSLEAGTAYLPNVDAPMDIYCNNGIVRFRDAELPMSYRRITGMSMNNNCYYTITGFNIKGTDTLRFAYMITTGGVNVLGSYTNSDATNNYSLYAGTADTSKYLRYNGGTYNSSSATGIRYDVVISPTGTTGMKIDSTWDTVDFTTETDFYIGTTSLTATSSKMRGSFYGNIEVDGRLKLIPCERLTDNEVGWYDVLSNTFYAPTGTTPTIVAYDSEHLIPYADTNGTNLFDSSSTWNTSGSVYQGSGGDLSFPYSTGGNKHTYFMLVEPNTTYRIDAEIFGDRLYVGALSDIINPADYTTSNRLNFDRTVTVRNNPTTPSYITTRATDKMIGVYYSNQTLPVNLKIQKLTEKETVQVKDSENNVLSTVYGEMLFGNGATFDEQNVETGTITRRFGVWIFDGTEQWTQSNTSSSSDYRMFYTPMANAGTNVFDYQCGRCNYFQWYSDTNGDAPTYAGARIYSCWKTTVDGNPILRIKLPYDQDINTGPLFKAWVKDRFDEGNPLFAIFPLAEPTTETVSHQTVHNNAGTNTITITQASIDNLPLEVKYKGIVEEEVEGE